MISTLSSRAVLIAALACLVAGGPAFAQRGQPARGNQQQAQPARPAATAPTAPMPRPQAPGQPRYPNEEFWSDQVFVNRFMATYGAHPATEPKMTNIEADFLQGLVEQMRIDPMAAAEALRGAIRPEATAAFDFILGNISFQVGDVAVAEQNYREAIRKFPEFLRAHRNLALIIVQRGDFENAIDHLTKTVELGGGDSLTFGLLGFSYISLDRPLSAEAAYRQALLYDPDNRNWRIGLARSTLEQKKYTEAIHLLDHLLEQNPSDAQIWLFQANAYLGRGDRLLAAANYEVVRRLGAADAEVLMRLGDIYLETGLTELAHEAISEGIRLNPDQPIERPFHAATVLSSRGRWDEATALVEHIRSHYQGRMDGGHELRLLKLEARIASGTGNGADSVQMLEEIVSRDPLDGESILLLADVYAAEQQYEKAQFLYERAGRIRGFQASAMVRQAKMLVQQKRYRQAASLLERAQNINPGLNLQRYLEHVRQAARSEVF